MAGTRLGQNWDKSGTRLGQDRDKTGTRLGQDWDKTGTRPGQDWGRGASIRLLHPLTDAEIGYTPSREPIYILKSQKLKTVTRLGQDRDKTGTRPGQD